MTLDELRRIESKLAFPLDPEKDLRDANRYRFLFDEGEVHKIRRVEGGSGYTLTYAELLYANPNPQAALVSFTAEANMYATTSTQAILPVNFFDPTYGANKSLRVVIRGMYSTTGTPTFTLGFRQDSVTGAIWGSSKAITAQSTVTNEVFEIEFDVTAVNPQFASTHNTINLAVWGLVLNVSTGSNSFSNASSIGTLTPSTTVTLTTADAIHYLVPTTTCGTSNAANKWQMFQLEVFGLN